MSTSFKLKFQKGNYRRGGLFMLPGVILGILLAYLLGDKGYAMVSITLFGFGTSAVLILLGNRSEVKG